MSHAMDAARDLVLQREVPLPPEAIWAAWTQPELLVKWFTPAPWSTVEARVDLRPGGELYFVMRSPEGEEFPNTGCILEAVPNRRLVWTNMLEPGFRPAKPPSGVGCDTFQFTCVLTLTPQGAGTLYTATAIHGDAAAKTTHESMGFHDGWGKALDQLIAVMSSKY